MPGWHRRTAELEKNGQLKVVGITEEQHRDRTVLFMQWQDMKWPVMLDSLNLFEMKAIPYTFLIDEYGIIQYRNPKPADLSRFLKATYSEPKKSASRTITLSTGEQAFLQDRVDSAIELIETVVTAEPLNATAQFRLGVCYRKRFDSVNRQPSDFNHAIRFWQSALDQDSNQYIWRRRIQQYGPRMDKPYSFYDWVPGARADLTARGEIPHTLIAEPTGAEFAKPQRNATLIQKFEAINPDPKGQIAIDSSSLVKVVTTVVPSTGRGRPTYRVHLRFTPDSDRKVHWTNDAGKLSLFPALSGVTISNYSETTSVIAKNVASTEERTFEFEVTSQSAEALADSIKAAAFYYVCEEVGGQCLYLRQDIEINLK